MEKFKKFTRSITTILLFVLSLSIAFVIAQPFKFTGILVLIDNLGKNSSSAFWFLSTISRLFYGALCAFAIDYFIFIGESKKFFWFEEEVESRNYRKQPVDQSGPILMSIVLFLVFFLVSWVALFIFTGISVPLPFFYNK